MTTHIITALACASLLATFSAESPLAEHLQKGLFEEEANHNLDAAISEYTKIISESDQQRRIVATALIRLAECYRKLDKEEEARKITERLARDYSDFEPPGFKTRLNSVVATAPSSRRDELAAQLARLRDQDSELVRVFPESSKKVQDIRRQISDLELQISAEPASSQSTSQANYLTELGRLLDNSPDLLNAPATNNLTFLQHAAYAGDTALIEFLLKKGARADRSSPNNVPPLSIVVSRGYKKAAELLIKGGANVNYRDPNGRTPLHTAAEKGFIEMSDLLLNNGVDVNVADSAGATPVELAAAAGQADEITFLAKHGGRLDAVNSSGLTPIFKAVVNNQLPAVIALLDAGSDVKAASNRNVLFAAVASGRSLEILSTLLAHGANPNARDSNGNTPLIQAAEQGGPAMVNLLLENKADPNLQNDEGNTTLHSAITLQSDTQLVSVLIDRGANPNIQNRYGRTPLHLAAGGPPDSAGLGNAATYNGRLIPSREKVRFLLAHKADPNIADEEGMTSLHYATYASSVDVVELLLKAGANPDLKTTHGLRPADFAQPQTVGVRQIPSSRPTEIRASPAPPSKIVALLNEYSTVKTNAPPAKEDK